MKEMAVMILHSIVLVLPIHSVLQTIVKISASPWAQIVLQQNICEFQHGCTDLPQSRALLRLQHAVAVVNMQSALQVLPEICIQIISRQQAVCNYAFDL